MEPTQTLESWIDATPPTISLAAGYPKSQKIGCESGAPEHQPRRRPGRVESGLSFENGQYT